jgi:hypothetical protein
MVPPSAAAASRGAWLACTAGSQRTPAACRSADQRMLQRSQPLRCWLQICCASAQSSSDSRPALGSGRRLGDLLPGADRAELDVVYRQQLEKGLTPGRRDSSRHTAADSGGYNQRTSVPESPLAASFGIAAESDERAELTAALKCRSPGADVRSMHREGNLFGRFAFRPTC